MQNVNLQLYSRWRHPWSPQVFYSLLMFFSMIMMANAQSVIKGVVKDEKGMPIPGANVLLKGTQVVSSTDFDGNYTIKLADNAKVLINDKFGLTVIVRYPAAILPLLVLGLLVYLRRARSNVLNQFTSVVKTTRQLGDSPLAASHKNLGNVWWLAPLPNLDGTEVTARELELTLQWQDRSHRNTILVAIASVLMAFMVCYFAYLGFITNEFLKSIEFAERTIWGTLFIFSAIWSLFQIYAWWRQSRVPEFEDGQIQDDHSRREFLAAFAIICVVTSVLGSKGILGRIREKIATNPRFLQHKPRRSVPEPMFPIGSFRQNTNSQIFYGILPSKPAKRLAREIIPVVHCLPQKPGMLTLVQNTEILSKITFDTDSKRYDKKKPHVQLSRSACAFEQAALSRIASNDIESACLLLLCGVQHDLLYSQWERRPSIHIYDLLAGLTIRYEKPQHFKTLKDLIDKQQNQINIVRRCNIQLDPMTVIHKRQKIWEDTTSNWHKRWANKSKPLKWSGVPM